MKSGRIPSGELAYIAGFFDGEGSIVITSREKGGLHLLVVLVNTDRLIIEAIRARFQSGSISVRSRAGSLGKRPAYAVQWSGRGAAEVLRVLYPHLRLKKGQADIALRFQKTFTRKHCGKGVPDAVKVQRESARQEMQEVRLRAVP